MKHFNRILVPALCLFLLSACGGAPGPAPEKDEPALPAPESEKDGPVLLASVLDPSLCEPERSIKTFQDIASFFARRIDQWTQTYRGMELTENDRTAVLEYVDLLIREFDYEITASYHFDPSAADPFDGHFTDGTWEVCLGLTTADTGREQTGSATDVPSDIVLYCKNGELGMWFTDLFHTEDYGYRPSDSEGDRFGELYGPRAPEAYYLEHGRYRNESDGVLSVEAGTHDEDGGGEAVILLNGEQLLRSSSAYMGFEMYTEHPCDDYRLLIRDFLPNASDESIQITLPTTLTGGEVFTLSDGLGKRGDSPIYIICCPGDGDAMFSSSAPTPRSAIEACTVRILQWSEEECVVYASLEGSYELEPITLEILAAVPAYEHRSQTVFREEKAVELKVGKALELEYDGSHVLRPNYETYDWRISSGQGVAISGSGDRCTVTAVSPGEVIITCVYSYGTDSANVLTGAPENENHTRSQTYYLNIVP